MDSAAQKSAGPLHLLALPDDLLLRILKQPVLSIEERFDGLPLVCKRWAEVAPKAVEAAEGHANHPRRRARLLSLHSWLTKHAAEGSLRQLCLWVQPSPDEAEEQEALLRHSVLPACSRLHELQLHFDSYCSFGLEEWAAHLTHLRCLTLSSTEGVRVTAQLHGLTRMQELSLDCWPLELSEGAVLPPSLTQLKLGGLREQHLPLQLAALTALQALELKHMFTAAGGLTALTWLKRLGLTGNTHLPSCLSALTQLSALHLCCTPAHHNNPAATAAAQEEAVGGLPNLVHLTMVVYSGLKTSRVPRLPATLSALSHLQSMVWDCPLADEPALPPGPYLASLTRLEMPTSVTVANLQLLSQQAGQLAQLTLLYDSYAQLDDAEGRVAVACWAGGHAPLQRLGMVRQHCFPRTAVLEAACRQAEQRKPGLQIEVLDSYSTGQL